MFYASEHSITSKSRVAIWFSNGSPTPSDSGIETELGNNGTKVRLNYHPTLLLIIIEFPEHLYVSSGLADPRGRAGDGQFFPIFLSCRNSLIRHQTAIRLMMNNVP